MKSRDTKVFIIFLFPGLLITLVFIIIPLLMALRLAFYELESYISPPVFVGLKQYATILKDGRFWRALSNSVVYSSLSIFFQILLGIIFALLLNEKFKGRSFARGLSLLPYILPTVAVALIWQWMMDPMIGIITISANAIGLGRIHWIDTPKMAMFTVVLVSVWTWTPFITTCFLAALQTIPKVILDAAKVDGASAWHRFFHITIPYLKPVLVIIILLRGIWMFNKFEVVWLLTGGGPLGSTEHLPILIYSKAFQSYNIGEGTAIASISFIFLTVIVFIYLKFFDVED